MAFVGGHWVSFVTFRGGAEASDLLAPPEALWIGDCPCRTMGAWNVRCLAKWTQCPESMWTREHVRLTYKELVRSLDPSEVLHGTDNN